MTQEKEDALHAAMLAKMVGVSLNTIDSMAVDRTNRANRIDMNQFISGVVNPNKPQQQIRVPQNQGFAEPIPEHIVQQMVPDIPSIPQQTHSTVQHNQLSNSSEIENILKNIDKNLESLVSFIKNG